MMYNNSQNRYNNRSGGSNMQRSSARPPVKPQPLLEDYVGAAEAVIRHIEETDARNVISTSKLRSLFSLFTDIYDEVTLSGQAQLTRPQVSALNTARVRVYYEFGRDEKSVGGFIRNAKLLEYMMDIGNDAEKLLRFYQYMEALVAFHRYFFGEKKDKQ
ncbi:MAG: type III-A CRISPR-associated protein Csm2 [bacterium]